MDLLQTLFESAEIPADFKEKTTALFEAAVQEKMKAQVLELQESYDARLEEAKKTFVTESLAAIDSVYEEAIVEWAKENSVALDASIKVGIAESFLQEFKQVFEKAEVELHGDTEGKITSLQESVAAAEKAALEAKQELKEAQDKLTTIEKAKVLESVTAGLSVATVERIKMLSEAFDSSDLAEYARKLALVKEAVSGTYSNDSVTVPVDSTTSNVAQVENGGPGEDGSIDKTVKVAVDNTENKTGKDTTDPIKEQFQGTQAISAPHLHSDLIEETLKLFK